jgi:hypothetical protein
VLTTRRGHEPIKPLTRHVALSERGVNSSPPPKRSPRVHVVGSTMDASEVVKQRTRHTPTGRFANAHSALRQVAALLRSPTILRGVSELPQHCLVEFCEGLFSLASAFSPRPASMNPLLGFPKRRVSDQQ